MHRVNPAEILYAAAHAGFPDTEPLGGGKAVADYLTREHPDWTVLSPRSLNLSLAQPLADMTELQYARFCRQFERATTDAILARAPRRCVVLANDISEGPDFRRLGEAGYRIATIFHVDVVEYFTKFYLRNLVRPESLTQRRWWSSRFVPDLFRLVFTKQEDCVRHSRRLVVPSSPMREVILRCYPWCPVEKIAVVPWGNLAAVGRAGCPQPADGAHGADELPRRGGDTAPCQLDEVSDDEFVVITLSRLSPEKGIERLLRALRHVRVPRLRVFICGAAAYMKGRAYERKLRRLAAGLPVTFTGHVTGARKAALLARADLLVSPSRHESYGLTIAEALAHGCRVISHGHYGARGVVVDCGDPKAIVREIEAASQQRPPRRARVLVATAAAEVGSLLAAMAEN